MSVRRIVQSVLSCKFDEALCSSVENLASTNLEAGLAILEGLEHSELNTQSETFSSAQVAVYLAYIHRFILAYGHNKVPSHYKSSLCQYLDTKDSDLAILIVQIGKSVMAQDPEICDFFFRYYFKHRDNAIALRVITEYADYDSKNFYKYLDNFLLEKSTQFFALELLGRIVINQSAHLRQIAETPCFNTLLCMIETEETLIVESTLAIRVLSMLLPFIPSYLPPLLSRLFSLVARLSKRAWHTTHLPLTFVASKDLKDNQQLNVVVGLLVVYLYGMFPCSFLEFIRAQDDKRLRNALKPLLSKMTFNQNLLITKESELAIDRWKQRDPHDIVAECMGLTRGASVVDSDVIDDLKEQLIAQQKSLAALELREIREPKETPQGDGVGSRFHNALQRQEHLWLLFLLNQYQRRAAHLEKEVMLTRAKADEAISSNSRISHLDAEISSLHSHSLALSQDHARALAHAQKMNREAWEMLQKEREEKEEIEEKCGSLLFDATQLAVSRQELVDEVNEKTAMLTQQQVKLQDAYDEVMLLENDLAKLKAVNDDLLTWKDNQINKGGGDTDLQLLQEEIEQRDENISDLVEQLEHANAQIAALSENYQSSLVLIQQLDQEKAHWQEQITMARNVLEKQRVVDTAKLKSVEDKYNSVKSLYLGVEKRMLELRSENEKARHS